MKQIKKLASLLLALAMVFALSCTAFAAEAKTIQAGETYTAYKIFDATINGDNAAYSISKNSEWLTAVQTYAAVEHNGLTLTETADKTGYLVTVGDGFSAETFAEELAKALTGKTAAGSAQAAKAEGADAATVSIDVSAKGDGYYLVTSSLGSICQLTTAGTLTIVEKNEPPKVDKTSDAGSTGDQQYAAIGDTVNYTVTVTDGVGTTKAITLKDTMSEALDLDANSITIKVGDNVVANSNYTLATEAHGFTIVFNAAYVSTLGENDAIVVTYSAALNAKAITVDKINNTASIDYSNQTNTSTDEEIIKTNSFSVLKYASSDTSENPTVLAGATFKLTDANGTTIKLVKIDDNNYRVAEANEEGAVETFTTVSSGNITIKGVDSDKAYKLVETVAPNGYNLLTDPVSVTVAADNSTVEKIANSAGSTLPTTGGMGTTIFYIAGAILVLGAGVVLVTRRRMNGAK